ncbi:hypothetical protein [Streptomyces sp. B6B3]|uniref:hypothetical protein n=1 Tax=Streptomyces sp. B6B3 TaxID=3153570 RepID=UPI00325F238F
MNRRAIVPLVAVVGLLLAGCGEETSDGGGAGGNGAGSSAGTGGGNGGGNDGGQSDDAALTMTEEQFGQRAEQIATQWPDVSGVAPDRDDAQLGLTSDAGPADQEITVTVGRGACDLDWGAWLEETDDLVIVGAWTEPDPEADVCTDQLMLEEVDLSLGSDLGDRAIVDAGTGEELTREPK